MDRAWHLASSFVGSHVAFPHFKVPHYLDRPPTGILEYDLVPVITMAACFPSLAVWAAHRDFINFALYFLGFVVAVVYHLLQLGAHEGLASTRFLGLDGAGWRTIDILCANILLARTFGHALLVTRPSVAALPNVVLPIGVVALLTTYPGVTLGLCARLTAAAMLLTLLLQLVYEGRPLLHQLRVQFSNRRMVASLVLMAAGIVVFALPTYQPERYWLYHSIWHCLMGWGYYWLYQGLQVYMPQWRIVKQQLEAAAHNTTAGSSVPSGFSSDQRASAQDLYAMQDADAGATVAVAAPRTTRAAAKAAAAAAGGPRMGRTDSADSSDAMADGDQDEQEAAGKVRLRRSARRL